MSSRASRSRSPGRVRVETVRDRGHDRGRDYETKQSNRQVVYTSSHSDKWLDRRDVLLQRMRRIIYSPEFVSTIVMDVQVLKVSGRVVSVPSSEVDEMVVGMMNCATELLDFVVFDMLGGKLPNRDNAEVECMLLGILSVAVKQSGAVDDLTHGGSRLIRYLVRKSSGVCSVDRLMEWEVEILAKSRFDGCKQVMKGMRMGMRTGMRTGMSSPARRKMIVAKKTRKSQKRKTSKKSGKKSGKGRRRGKSK